MFQPWGIPLAGGGCVGRQVEARWSHIACHRAEQRGWMWLDRCGWLVTTPLFCYGQSGKESYKNGISDSDINIYKWQTLGVLVPADDPSTFSYSPPTSGVQAVQATGHPKSLGYFPLLIDGLKVCVFSRIAPFISMDSLDFQTILADFLRRGTKVGVLRKWSDWI